VLCLAAAAYLAWRCAPPKRVGVALLLGLGAVAYHAMYRGSLDATIEGFAWFATIAAAAAVACACSRDERLRPFVLAGLVAVVPVVMLRGALQVFSEHPATVATFNENKEAFFRAQGWTPDSPQALGYVRRLMQAEATGWFGFSNVFAGVAAAAAVLLGSVSALYTNARAGLRLLCAGASLLCIAGVALAGSKGGFAALIAGFVACALFAVFTRRPGVAGSKSAVAAWAFTLAAVAGTLALVLARGAVGTRLGELSIFFRSMYLEGAARIIAAHPILGVGPGHFRDAYLLAKNPFAPEDVASPHSVLFDYVATLGVGGLALGAVWFGLVLHSAKVPFAAQPEDNEASHIGPRPFEEVRDQLRLAGLVVAVGVVGAAMLEQAIASPSVIGVRIVGLAMGTALAGVILMCGSHRAVRIAGAAAALSLAAHAQIEMTFTTPGSMLWLALLLAASAKVPLAGSAARAEAASPNGARVCGAIAETQSEEEPARHPAVLVTCFACLSGVIVAGAALVSVARWESGLRAAAEVARPIAMFASRARDASASQSERAELLADLSRATNRTVTDPAVALGELRHRASDIAMRELARAAKTWPTHAATARAASGVGIAVALSTVPPDQGKATTAIEIARAATASGSAQAWSWLATALAAVGLPQSQQHAALENAAKAAPFEPLHPLRLARLLEISAPSEAEAWAKRAMELDERRALDPVSRLEKRDIEFLQRIGSKPHN
jgi:hypothetical protein